MTRHTYLQCLMRTHSVSSSSDFETIKADLRGGRSANDTKTMSTRRAQRIHCVETNPPLPTTTSWSNNRQYLDERPILKRKAIKWTRRRIFKRKQNEPTLATAVFLKFINELFIKYDVFINPDAPAADRKHMQWKSEYTALRYMHKLKLTFGFYQKGYCDGWSRTSGRACRPR